MKRVGDSLELICPDTNSLHNLAKQYKFLFVCLRPKSKRVVELVVAVVFTKPIFMFVVDVFLPPDVSLSFLCTSVLRPNCSAPGSVCSNVFATEKSQQTIKHTTLRVSLLFFLSFHLFFLRRGGATIN